MNRYRILLWIRRLNLAGLAMLPIISMANTPMLERRLQIAFPTTETGFDPAKVHDAYSGAVVEALFERLVTYDYRARPLKIIGGTAHSFTRSADAKTYVFKLKEGIQFSPDAAFSHTKTNSKATRELTSFDYAYAIQRLADPAVRSPWQFLIEGKIEGLDAKAKQAEKGKVFDYQQKIKGIQTPDRYTLIISLTRPDPNFLAILAMPALSAVAKEVIETYHDSNAHPIGTGAFALSGWRRGSKISLSKNPFYRGSITDPARPPIRIDGVDIQIIEESQSRWLAFRQKSLDMIGLPSDLVPKALDNNQLNPALTAEGIQLQRSIDPEITYTYFNMQDPIVGGTTPEKIALRRALVMSYDSQREIAVLHRKQAVPITQIVPQGLPGFDAQYQPLISQAAPELGNKLLDYYGYKIGANGWRQHPNGQPLIVTLSSTPDSKSRTYDELWTRSAKAIHIQLKIKKAPFSDLLKAEKECKLQMRGAAWIADYADGDNFMMLLYGKNIHQSNNACFQDPTYDALYEQSQRLPDSPERTKLYTQMNRRIEHLAPWKLGVSRYRNSLVHSYVKGFQQHPLIRADWMYLELKRGEN